MAERTSHRSVSRRTTPQLASGPARNTRAMRSQRHDMNDSDKVYIGSKVRQRGKHGPAEELHKPAGQSKGKGGKQREVKNSRALQDLSMVHEDPDLHASDSSSSESDIEDVNPEQPLINLKLSPRRISAFSGTTARTSRSAQDISDLNVEEMMDSLEDLSGDSEKILSLLMPREISETSTNSLISQLQTRGSSENRNLDRLATRFSVPRNRYGGDLFISCHDVVAAYNGRENITDDTEQWRLQALLQKANLAILASGMLSRLGKDGDLPFLEALDRSFPAPFLTGFAPSNTLYIGYSVLSDDLLQLAIEIRTQYAMMLLARHVQEPNFDSDLILEQVFYQDGKHLRGWSVIGLGSEDLSSKVQHSIVSRLEQFRDIIAKSENPISSVGLLQANFSWNTLALRTIGWVRQRLEELDSHIDVNGGAVGIHSTPTTEIQRMRMTNSSMKDKSINGDSRPQLTLEYNEPSELHEKPKQTKRTKGLGPGLMKSNPTKAKEGIAMLKHMENKRKSAIATEQLMMQQIKQPHFDVQVTATAGPSTSASRSRDNADHPVVPITAPAEISTQQHPEPQQDEAWRPQEDDGEDGLLASHPRLTPFQVEEIGRQLHSTQAKQQAESNKENIDLPRIQGEVQPGMGQKRSLLDRQPNATRVFWGNDSPASDQEYQPEQTDEIENVSADEGFQKQQTASEIVAKQRRSKPTAKRPAPRLPRSQGPSPKKVRNHDIIGPDRLEVIPDRPDNEPSPSLLMAEYKNANTAAKQRKNFEVKAPQTRRPWSDKETERLLELIAEHGISWKLLMDKDFQSTNILQGRGQVGLKDKARNVKVDFLKAGPMKIPAYLEGVPITKIQIERLNAQGIEYDPETGQRVDAIVSDDDE